MGVRVAALGAVLLAASGCAVGVDAPDVSPATREACARFIAKVPDRVADQAARQVDQPDQGAAWGDPAITLRCGVGTPEGFTPTATCQEVNGVGWYIPQDQLDSSPETFTITTIGRSPRIELTVPKAYLPPAAVLVDLAPAVKSGTRRTAACQ